MEVLPPDTSQIDFNRTAACFVLSQNVSNELMQRSNSTKDDRLIWKFSDEIYLNSLTDLKTKGLKQNLSQASLEIKLFQLSEKLNQSRLTAKDATDYLYEGCAPFAMSFTRLDVDLRMKDKTRQALLPQ